jgi:hypothetical protein
VAVGTSGFSRVSLRGRRDDQPSALAGAGGRGGEEEKQRALKQLSSRR